MKPIELAVYRPNGCSMGVYMQFGILKILNSILTFATCLRYKCLLFERSLDIDDMEWQQWKPMRQLRQNCLWESIGPCYVLSEGIEAILDIIDGIVLLFSLGVLDSHISISIIWEPDIWDKVSYISVTKWWFWSRVQYWRFGLRKVERA